MRSKLSPREHMLREAHAYAETWCDEDRGYLLRFHLSNGSQLAFVPEGFPDDWIRTGVILAVDGPLVLTEAVVAIEVERI